MRLKPYKELIAMSKEKLDEAMATPRAAHMRKKAELEMSKIDVDIADKQSSVEELCINKDINFDKVLNTLDEIALLERRKGKYQELIHQLFPKD